MLSTAVGVYTLSFTLGNLSHLLVTSTHTMIHNYSRPINNFGPPALHKAQARRTFVLFFI